MHKYISGFLDEVCEQIKYKKIHRHISEELESHISGLKHEYIENGMSEDEATKKAVKQMGDPINIGKDLNKTHRPKTEWSIIGLIATMVLIGGVSLFSIASDTASLMNISQFTKNYVVYTLLGVGTCVFFYYFDYTKLERYSLHIFIGTTVLLYVSTLYAGPYIRIGGFNFNPASMALPFLLISFSGLTNKWVNENVKDILKLFAFAGLAILSYVIQIAFIPIMLIIIGFLAIVTMAVISDSFKGNRKRYLLSIYGSAIMSMILVLISMISRRPYLKARLSIFLNPSSAPNAAGYINGGLVKLLSTAKLFGKNNNLYINYDGVRELALVEANTDFIFTYIVSAFGWMVGILTISVIILTIVRMFLATRKINHQYGRYLAGSIITIFAIQGFGNILMNLGLSPIAGLSLPLISYGGTNFVINMGLIGLLLGVYRRKDLLVNKLVKN